MKTTHTGLDTQQVIHNQKLHGPNILAEKHTQSVYEIFAEQFSSPLVLLLVAVSIVTTLLHEYSDSIVILVVIVVNAIIGTIQEHKAAGVVATLRQLSESTCNVIRNGIVLRIPIREITVDDCIMLSAGDIVPADGVVLESRNLTINESKVTGESLPAVKSPDEPKLYRSTTVVSGSGVMQARAIGSETEIGILSSSILDNVYNQTPLEKQLSSLSRRFVITAIIGMVALFAIGFFQGRELLNLFGSVISLAVSAIPEGLPIVVTVALAIGAFRISRAHGLLKNLPSGATLATVSYICTDKTGTLTHGTLSVKEIIPLSEISVTEMQSLIVHSLDIERVGETTVGDIVDTVLGEYLDEQSTWEETKELSFTSEQKFNAKEYFDGTNHVQVYKGAPELLGVPHETIAPYTESGLRALAIGYKHVANHSDFSLDDIIPVALVIFEDPIRDDVAQAISDCTAAGVSVMMITGDTLLTARHVATQVGIIQSNRNLTITGSELQSYSDEQVSELLPKLAVVARAHPMDKERIVRLLQSQNHIVAMTGDGVNDGPSIALADIGIAMGISGTEVAKQAADFILVTDSFSNIRDGIMEARIIMENLSKNLTYTFTTLIGEVSIVTISVIAGMPLPLLPVQILWMNVITDGFMNIPLALERAEPSYAHRNYTRYATSLLSRIDWIRVALLAGLMATASLAFFVHITELRPLVYAQTTMLVLMSLFQWVNAISMRRHNDSIVTYRISDNPYLLFALGIQIILLFGGIYFGFGRELLSTTPLGSATILTLIAISLSALVIDELYKWYRRSAIL
jgi:Ca2+-transporting ATPase